MSGFTPGARVGRFEVGPEVSCRGASRTWLAHRVEDDAPAVIAAVPTDSPDVLLRFDRVIGALSAADHAALPKVMGKGRKSGLRWVATSPAAGQGPQVWAQGLPADARLDAVLRIGLDLSGALEVLHTHEVLVSGISQRDVLIRRDGSPVLLGALDLRWTQPLTRGPAPARQAHVDAAVALSPEQLLGLGVDHRADLYSLGVLLFELAAGRGPHVARTTRELVVARCTTPAAAFGSVCPDATDAAAVALDRAVERDPADRPRDGRRLTQLLERALGVVPQSPSLPLRLLPSRFVGRQDELQILRDRVLQGPSGSALVHGPAGAGVSRLLVELRAGTRLHGARTVLVPGGPRTIAAVLAHLVGPGQPPATRQALLAGDAGLLLRALGGGERASLSPLPPDLAHAAARVVLRAAAERPLLIAVDDADQAPLDQLRALSAGGLLVLGTHRPQDVGVPAVEMRLPPLTPAELAEAARSMAGDPGPAMAWSHADVLGGNPGALAGLVARSLHAEPREATDPPARIAGRSWPEALELAEAAMATATPAEALAELQAPDTPCPATGVLRYRIELVRSRAGLQQGDDEAAMAHAARASEVAPTPVDRSIARLSATLAALRAGHLEACLAETRSARRAAGRFGDGDLNARWATVQARLLAGLGRLWEARRVLRDLRESRDLDPRSGLGLTWTAARVATQLCRWDEVEELVAAGREGLAAHPLPRAEAGLAHTAGWAALRQGHTGPAVEELTHALAAVERLDDPEFEAEVRADLALALTMSGDRSATRHLNRAVELCRRSGGRRGLLRVALVSLRLARVLGDVGAATQAAALLSPLNPRWLMGPAAALLSAERAEAWRVQGLQTSADKAQAFVDTSLLEDPHDLLATRLLSAWSACREGALHPDVARALCHDALRRGLRPLAAEAAMLEAQAGGQGDLATRLAGMSGERGDVLNKALLERASAGLATSA